MATFDAISQSLAMKKGFSLHIRFVIVLFDSTIEYVGVDILNSSRTKCLGSIAKLCHFFMWRKHTKYKL